MPIPNPLFVGIDVSLLHLDLAVLNATGQRLISHRVFANTLPGCRKIQTWLIELMGQHGGEQLHIAAEATSYYWLPAFYYLDQDLSLAAFNPQLHLLNARWVRWYKRSFPTDNKDDRTDPFYIADFIRTRRRTTSGTTIPSGSPCVCSPAITLTSPKAWCARRTWPCSTCSWLTPPTVPASPLPIRWPRPAVSSCAIPSGCNSGHWMTPSPWPKPCTS